ncbi:hypothetical protein CXB51_025635 [Gossypium anomalum]|uniref:Replication factor C C-terminal domain-containing protein n=1 Tax=Gossypium anomalum TaxID=47600 RepID=A0A8J5YRA9_9ROSI|nr:hypothetical protein CXB51_025635 [Gossypium anomalum]
MLFRIQTKFIPILFLRKLLYNDSYLFKKRKSEKQQSTHMASQKITEEAVYLCTGNPLPKDIEQISYWLLNESFTESFKCISLNLSVVQLVKFLSVDLLFILFKTVSFFFGVSETKTRKGLALIDIVREVTMFVFKIKMPLDVRVQLINDSADIETKKKEKYAQFPAKAIEGGAYVSGHLLLPAAILAPFMEFSVESPHWLFKVICSSFIFCSNNFTFSHYMVSIS